MSTDATTPTVDFAVTDARMRRLPAESLYSYLDAVRLCRHALDTFSQHRLPRYLHGGLHRSMEDVLMSLTGYYHPIISITSGSLTCAHCTVVNLIKNLDWQLHAYSREGGDVPFEPFLNAAREAIEDLDCPPWTH